jgi:hypothetical protein
VDDAKASITARLSREAEEPIAETAMSLTFLAHAVEESALQESAPTVGEIQQQMRYAERGIYTLVPSCEGFAECLAGVLPRALGAGISQPVENRGIAHSRLAINGGWVGPAPRITRAMPTGINVTHAAWVWHLTDEQQAASGLQGDTAQRAFADRLRDDIHTSLALGATHNTLGDHWTVTVQPWAEATNGSLEWWASGKAAGEVNYANRWPNPITQAAAGVVPGPAVDNPVGPNPSEGMSLFTMAMIALGVVVGGYVVVQVTPAIVGAFKSGSSPSAAAKQKNPTRRRAGR